MSGDPEETPASGDEEDTSQPEQNGPSGPTAGSERDVSLLRQSWEFASILQFCRMFAEPLKLRSFSADQLEAALAYPQNHTMFTSELVYKLIRANANAPFAEREADHWEQQLGDKLRRKWSTSFPHNPLVEQNWFTTSTQTRMQILHALCDWRSEECAVTREAIRKMAEDPVTNGDTLRHTPIGEDAQGARYFFLSDSQEDCWLFRERPPPKDTGEESKGIWETVGTSVEGMQQLADSLAESQHPGETSLRQKLTDTIIPALIETAPARKRMEDKAYAMEAAPRKRSSRLQVMTLQKEEADRRAREEEEEEKRLEAENRKRQQDRERELRLMAKQKDDEDRQLASIALRNKLSGLNPEGPSREERMARRIQDGFLESMTSSPELQQNGDGALLELENEHDAAAAPAGAETQEPASGAAAGELQPWPQADLRNSSPQPQALPPQHMQETPAPKKEEEVQDDTERLHDPAAEPVARRLEHSPGWCPLGVLVPTRPRRLETRPASSFAPLVAVAKGKADLAPWRSWRPDTGAEAEPDDQPLLKHGLLVVKPGSRHRPSQKAREMDIAEEEEEEEGEPAPSRPAPRSHLSRRRPSRKRKEMDDVDYEEEEESESESESDSDEGYRPRSRTKRAQALAAANAAKAAAAKRRPQSQPQQSSHGHMRVGHSPADVEYSNGVRKLQEAQRLQQQQIQARFPIPCAQRTQYEDSLRQQLQGHLNSLKQRHAQMKAMEASSMPGGRMQQQPGFNSYNQASLEAMATQKAARERHMALQQQQHQQQQLLMQVMQSLPPQQRAQMQLLPQQQQIQYLERVRLQQMHQHQVQLEQQQRLQQQQQQLQQQVLAQLTPEQIQIMRDMPRNQQQETLSKLTQQMLVQQQHHQSQMMQQQMQSAGMTGGIFSDVQMQREGLGLRISSPAMHPLGQSQAGQHSSPVLRSSSGTMSGGSGGGGMNPMLRQMEHQSMAMQPSLPQASSQYGLPGSAGGQRWMGAPGSQRMPPRFPGMIPNVDGGGGGLAPDMAARTRGMMPMTAGHSLPPAAMQHQHSGAMQRMGSGSPHLQPGHIQAMPSPAWQGGPGSRPSSASPSLADARQNGGALHPGTPGLPQHGAQQMPLSAVADRTDPHFGEDFGHLDSMLASDAFDDQPDHPGAQPPADGPQGPKLLASAEEQNGNDNPPGKPAAPEQGQVTAPAVTAAPDKQEPAEHRPEKLMWEMAAAKKDEEAWMQLAENQDDHAQRAEAQIQADPKPQDNLAGKAGKPGADLVADGRTAGGERLSNGDS